MEKSFDSLSKKELEVKIAQLERRVSRERQARKNAELILESKSIELYDLNKSLASVNEELAAQLERNKQFLQSINEFSGYLIGKSNLNEIAWTLSEKLILKYKLEHCTIFKVEDGMCYQIPAFNPKSKSRKKENDLLQIPLGEGIVGAAAENGRPELVNDTRADKRYIADGAVRLSELAVPIISEGRVIGVINAEHSLPGFFNNDHQKTITTISSLISVFFKNSLTEQRNLNLESGIEKRTEIINSLVHNLHSGLLLNDENGRIVLINDVFRRVFKFNIPDNMIIGQDQRQSAELVKHLFKKPAEFIEIVDHCRTYNKSVFRKELEMIDGTLLDCDFIPIYTKGEFIGQLWQVTDVTSTRTYQKKIQASEEKYRGIIENMELGLLEADINHNIIKAYDWFCDMTGYTEEELIGRNVREVFFPKKYHDIMDAQDELRKKGEQSIYEVQMKKKNGELIWVLISGAPFYDQDGKVIGTIGIHYNIDARKKLEEDLKQSQKQTEKAREAEKQFLANMSHEIRNPLNAIIGITNLLYDTRPTNEQLKHLDKLKYSSDILIGLISGVLDISKIESGNFQLTEKPIHIADVVNGLIEIASFNAQKKDITYINKIPAKSKFRVMVDPTAINQIFLNLINNATKFTHSGSITVEGRPLEAEGEYINYEFKVTDTGIGIEPDKLDSVFEKFKQASSETKLKYGGTGLGLNIVKKLVSMYGGEIRAESEVGKGTSFIFSMKLKKAEKGDTESSTIIRYSTNTQKSRLLVAEDNEINQYYLSGILKRWNIEHDLANNGDMALKFLQKRKYDLILMDIRMPGVDGYQATRKLRSMKENENCEIPIIALTASALVDERERALEAGMNYHLTKPYTAEDLGVALSKFGIITEIENNKKMNYEFAAELDTVSIENYFQDNLDRTLIMFEVFDRVIDEDFDKLKACIEKDQWEDFGSLAHKIKPNFAMVGLTHLSVKMKEYELAKKDTEFQDMIRESFSKTEADFNRGKRIVKDEIDKLKKFLEKNPAE